MGNPGFSAVRIVFFNGRATDGDEPSRPGPKSKRVKGTIESGKKSRWKMSPLDLSFYYAIPNFRHTKVTESDVDRYIHEPEEGWTLPVGREVFRDL